MRRQYKIAEKLHRDYLRDKKRVIAKCEGLGIAYYEARKHADKLSMSPDAYVCVLSPNEYSIGCSYSDDVDPESLFLKDRDYELFELY